MRCNHCRFLANALKAHFTCQARHSYDTVWSVSTLKQQEDANYKSSVSHLTEHKGCSCSGGKSASSLGLYLNCRFIVEFHKDMEALGCLPPTSEPKATDHVTDMVTTIEQIITNGHGYAVDGDVFFDVASLPGYGRLSGRAQARCHPLLITTRLECMLQHCYNACYNTVTMLVLTLLHCLWAVVRVLDVAWATFTAWCTVRHCAVGALRCLNIADVTLVSRQS